MQRLFKGGFQEELSKLKVSPTFGVSFGLPQSGDYPINPLTGHPVINPYGHTINGDGVKLGPVNVNPLVAFQVTKDEEGEKVVKPFVNLHVTPTHGFIHKVGGIKHKILHQIAHDHHHHHVHTFEKPHYSFVKPVYSKPWHGYGSSYYGGSPYDSSFYDDDHHFTDFDFYDKYDNFHDGYDRAGKSLNITARPGLTDIHSDDAYDHPYEHPSAPSSSSYHGSNQPSSGRVSFPRNKRDVFGKYVEKVSLPVQENESTQSQCCV